MFYNIKLYVTSDYPIFFTNILKASKRGIYICEDVIFEVSFWIEIRGKGTRIPCNRKERKLQSKIFMFRCMSGTDKGVKGKGERYTNRGRVVPLTRSF